MDLPNDRIPGRQVLKGLVCAALVAWALLTMVPLVGQIASELLQDGGPRPDIWQQAWGVLVLFTVFGLPVAFIATLVLGYPLWRLAERRGLTQLSHAAICGAICGAFIAALRTATTVLGADPGTSYGYSGDWIMIDGRLTPSGWASEFEALIILAVAGVCAGITAVWVARRS